MKLLSHVQLLQPHGLQPTRLLCPGFSRQRYQSGLPFPLPGDLPNPGIEPESPILQADTLPSEPPGKLCVTNVKRNVTKGTTLSTPNQGPGGQENLPESQSLPSQRTPSLLQHLMWVGITSFWKLPQFPGQIPSLQFSLCGADPFARSPISPLLLSLTPIHSVHSAASGAPSVVLKEGGSATTKPLAHGDGASSHASLCKQFSQDLVGGFNRAEFRRFEGLLIYPAEEASGF